MSENENIEKFFKSSFDKTPNPEPWNMPSEDVWQKIEKGIDQHTSTKFNTQKLVSLVTLFLLAILSIKTCSLHKDVTYLKDQLIECSARANQSGVNNQNSPKNNVLNQAENSESEKIKPAVEHRRSFKSKDAGNKSNILKGSYIQKNMSPPNTITDSLIDKYPEDLLSTDLITNNTVPAYLPEMNKTIFSIPDSLDPDTVFREIGTELPGQKIAKSHYVGITSALWSWDLKSSGTLANPLNELISGESINISKSFGAQYTREISKHWEVSAGIQYLERTLNTYYMIQLPYSTSDEMLSQGAYISEFNHSLPTSWGDVNSNVILTRSAQSQISSQEIVPLEYHIQNVSSIFHLPVQLKYFFKDSHKSFHVTGGILNELILKSKVEKLSLLSHHDIIKEKDVYALYNDQQIQHINLYVTGGVGYEINLSPQFKIGISALYARSLQPLYRSETYLQNVNGFQLALYGMKKL